MKPFLRWVGGKYSVIDQILPLLPEGKRLIDAFAGGGAIFLNAPHEKKIVADVNRELIDCYRHTASDPDAMAAVVRELMDNHNTEEGYYRVRDSFNEKDETGLTFLKAAQLIYLNRTCFNGLFRRNKKGGFNVPYGHLKKPYFPGLELKAFAAIATDCSFICDGYRNTISLAGAGDVIVCDPPYMPLENKNSFTAYAAGDWNFKQQYDLAIVMESAYQRGASVVAFNSPHDLMRDMYQDLGYTIHEIRTRRSVGATGKARGVVFDLMAVKKNVQ